MVTLNNSGKLLITEREGEGRLKTPPQQKEFRRPIAEILEDLRKPVPARLIKKKPVFSRRNGQSVRTGEVDYISWTTYVRLLDFYAPGWDYQVETTFDGTKVAVIGKLTIKAAEGDFTRCAIGNEDSQVDGFGDAYSRLRSICTEEGVR